MRIKILFLLTILFFIVPTVPAKHIHTEKYYQEKWCKERNGQLEYTLNDKTRVDCLLPDMAVEFDFAPKWAECIGQALYYGLKTEKTPACVLIIESKKDLKYLNRLEYTSERINPNIKNFIIQPD